jgi:transcriptional regulator with XRE-family HTH domain
MDIGRAIRICRAARGLSQAELARNLTIGQSQLSLIEAGKRTPSLGTLDQIAVGLGVPRHLLMLLSADANELNEKRLEELPDLAIALLRMLVSYGSPDTSGQLKLL